ncbi:mechanosensitive ion channel family protein [Fischerella sp. PCC 9605]|uniref:mechanosensitive ion channel family protein n=1 Tax=Fischerella sp. PCC 9605 TaxID=1173024 RepID=UPI0004BA9F2C|nr:mechanosensitive ion channel family protein [Fischerella sp. PCC 9605]
MSLNKKINRLLREIIIAIFVALLIIITPISTFAQSPSPTETPTKGVPVKLDDKTLFLIQYKLFSPSINQRAEGISSRIQQVADNQTIPVDTLRTSNVETEAGTSTIIYAQDIAILAVSDADAKAVKLTQQTLANQYLQTIKNAISQYREERSATYLTRAAITAAVSTIVLILTLLVLWNVIPRFYHWLDAHHQRWIPNIRIQNLDLLSSQQISAIIQGLTRILHFVIVVTLLYFYLSLVLSLFPQTKQFGTSLFANLQAALTAVWQGFLGYLPKLLRIGLIVLLTRYILSFLKFIFTNLERRTLVIQGFYPEWAKPTYQLLSFAIVAVATAIAFPYLPGSDSPAFQAISIVLGALVSFGSSTAIANAIAGFSLVYTRAFQIGDRVQVGDVMGFIEEKQLLVTRIRTLDNILVSIPNSALLSSNVINYNTLLKDRQTPVIVHTTVTLGYEAPWRSVHETLIAAAVATTDILSQPPPFVLQTALNDFYVSYQLRAYTNNPMKLERIYSELHQNIQDKCNEANIEICSPHYSAIRDGNQTTIPSEYLSHEYTAPGFRVNPLSTLFNFINPNSPSVNSQSSSADRASD